MILMMTTTAIKTHAKQQDDKLVDDVDDDHYEFNDTEKICIAANNDQIDNDADNVNQCKKETCKAVG